MMKVKAEIQIKAEAKAQAQVAINKFPDSFGAKTYSLTPSTFLSNFSPLRSFTFAFINVKWKRRQEENTETPGFP